MEMTYNKNLKRFEVTTTYQEYKAGYVQKVKNAGFRFTKEPVAVWYSDDPNKASLLISCADEVAKDMLEIRAQQRDTALAQSRAHNAEVGGILEDLGIEPYDFQKAGIAYASTRERVFFADEPGLGKTLQALASVHIKQAYPCVAVVPATLKINWKKEATRCVPELRSEGAIQILTGEKPQPIQGAKLYIINYDILKHWLPSLIKIQPKSIILDESHFAKNSQAQRTLACLELATGTRVVKEKGKRAVKTQVNTGIKYRYLLSGTPEPNRTVELEAQLDILGVLENFGGSWGFKSRYCDLQSEYIWVKNPKTLRAEQKRVFKYEGATHTDELQRKLREYVMVRRLKLDVLTSLPPKRHQCIELPANGLQHFIDEENEMESKHSQDVAELKKIIDQANNSGDQKTFEEASARLQKAYKAHFTEMARLQHDVAMAKVPYIVQYCLEVLEGEEKLAVAAHHHDVEDALIAAFEAADIKTVALTGRESPKQKDAAIEAFQNGDARVFVAGLKCGIGYTITRASRMVMAEMDWTPGVMDQTSDRIHRIGQTDSVLITYITLENSLDAKKVGMLLEKRDVSNRILDKPLKDFTVPSGIPEPEPEKPQGSPTHVFAILERLGIKESEVPF
jgi:SWI/SNF-related matrix-associated actin-dependent regulator of chromatin subfamily A-like protein 1